MTDDQFVTRMIVVCGIVIMLIMSLGMYLLEYRAGQSDGYDKAWRDLPTCQEDEYLYPVDNAGHAHFEGPGEAKPNEYGCIHIDRIG